MVKNRFSIFTRKTSARAVFYLLVVALAGCASPLPPFILTPSIVPRSTSPLSNQPTPLPSRMPLAPGQIIEYQAQSGDTLEAVAAHFNTTVEEIRKANSDLPRRVTTLIPGRMIRVPMYFAPFTGTPYQMFPDSEVIAGPVVSAFSTRDTVTGYPGALRIYSEYAFDHAYSGWEVVQVVARDYSLNPRLLLALLEYRTRMVTQNELSDEVRDYPLGDTDESYPGLAQQLSWAAVQLNDGYYGWRTGSLREFELADGRLSRPDPWQNAGTVAVQYLLAHWFNQKDFDRAVSPDGFIKTYRQLFGDPFSYAVELMPGNLEQPPLQLPFEPGNVWAFTGGPHPVWGDGLPWAAIDFAPPSMVHGCVDNDAWVTAVAPGVVVRSEPATVILDLDGDGDENSGWTILYFHIAERDRVASGTRLRSGDRIGHPSCEGGRATGPNVHIARRYNGEWISAAGALRFNLSNWVANAGEKPYQGTLSYFLDTILVACDCVNSKNQIQLFPGVTPNP